MSDTDSFIDEVTEEVRRDKLFGVFRKFAWIGILAVVLIVVGAAYNEWRKASERSTAQAFGDALLTALQQDAPAARADAIAAIDADAAGRAAIRGFLAADQAAASGDIDAASGHLQSIAGAADLATSYRELAEIKLVILTAGSMDAATRTDMLERLARPGAPYRVLAMEQQALALVAEGKSDEAAALARRILVEPNVTAGLRQRISQLMVALGQDADAA